MFAFFTALINKKKTRSRSTVAAKSFLVIAFILTALCLPGKGDAASPVLINGQNVIYLGPDIYITPDPGKKLDAAEIAARHEHSLQGTRAKSKTINLGPDAIPRWLSFSVTNNSEPEDWVLHFGDVTDGRGATVQKFLAYNHTGKRVITRALREKGRNGGFGEDLHGPALSTKIKRGETALFVVYLEPARALTQTITPALIRGDLYMQRLQSGNPLIGLAKIFFIGMTGFFIAVSFVRRHSSYLVLAAYYVIHGLLFTVENSLFFEPFPYAGAIPVLLFAGCILSALFVTKIFLDISVEDHTSNSFIFAGAAVVVLPVTLSAVLLGPAGRLDDFLIYIPALLGLGIAMFISFRQGQNDRQAGYYLAMAWLTALLGVALQALCGLDLIVPNALLMNMFWIALLPQSVFLITATASRIRLREEEERSSRSRENRAARSLARLVHSKESADQARLLRVIERERELMAELREREMLRTEEMRRAKEMADEANRAKSAFLAVVSHEIRTPMTGILGMVRLLNDTKLEREQGDYVQAIHKSGETMLALLNDILDFEKIERGSMELEDIDFDLPALVQGVVTLMSSHANDKGLFIRTDVPKNFPAYLVGDPTRLRQVLLNLVNNAIKFTETGGVTIRLRAEEPQDKNIYNVEFSVADTGIGISETARKNIFSPFAQADKTVSRKYGGTGLGLAICKRLIEAMGGNIDVRSDHGKGSTFHFTIQMKKGRRENVESFETPHRKAGPQLEKKHILVIEDNEMNRRVLKGFLEKDGHVVTLTDSGDQGLTTLRNGKFDVVFTDINLSGMSGLDVIRSIRDDENEAIARIPVMAITGNVAASDIEQYNKSGFNGFIAKPVDPDALRQALQKIQNGDLQKDFHVHKKDNKTAPIHQYLDTMAKNKTDVPYDIPEDFDSFSDALTAEPASKTGAALDEDMLFRLLQTLGREEFTSLIESFLEKTDEIIDNLEPLSQADQIDDIRARAHELKGMAANFGVRDLSILAGAIEKAAQDKDLSTALGKIKDIRSAGETAKTHLRTWMETAAG
jgi:signal transduction histidine kinase/DNA-binding NarL/FixJ family response regulator/HPt (histidine-containing phosphotransfer) domain-containing protein